MPPVTETWAEAIDRHLAANKAKGIRPATIRQLSFELAGSQETAKRTLNRVRATNRAAEETALAISVALGVDRSELPAAAKRPTTQELEDHLEELADLVSRGFEALGVTQAQLRPPEDGRSHRDAQ